MNFDIDVLHSTAVRLCESTSPKRQQVRQRLKR
jgi:hypothetical protein